MSSAQSSGEYVRNVVMSASPEQLQLMLYDGAIRYGLRALDAIRGKDREAAFNALDHAQRIVLELNHGLRPEANPELVARIVSLHNFVFRKLVEANVEQAEQPLDDALTILRHQRETWAMLIDRVRLLRASAGGEGGGGPLGASPGTASAGVEAGESITLEA